MADEKSAGGAVPGVGVTDDKTDIGLTPVERPEMTTDERVNHAERGDVEGEISNAGDPIANHNAPPPDPQDNRARDPYAVGDDTPDIGKGTHTSGGVGSLGEKR